MPHPYYFKAALVLGIIPALPGLNGILRPDAALRSVGFPVARDAESKKLVHALMRIYGMRNICVSSLMGLISTTGDETLMAMGLASVTMLGIVDGFVSRQLIGGGEWNHWSVSLVAGGLVAGLLGYLG